MNVLRRRSVDRHLAAILAADVAGYSRLMSEDEEGTLAALRVWRNEIAEPRIRGYRGRIVKSTGDGFLVEFASIVDALRCSAEVQAVLADSNAPLPLDQRIEFRIGINMGDVIVEDDDIFGDGVNVAARLAGSAEPGGICVSARVQEDLAGRLDLAFEDLGEQVLKNITRPVRAYRIRTTLTHPVSGAPGSPLSRSAGEGAERQRREAVEGNSAAPALPDQPSIAVLPFQNMSGDPEQEYFADGMVEEIITALSRIKWLFVIARNSSFTYKGQAIDIKRIGHELGVSYVLEGSVRKAGGRVRITAQLIGTLNGAHLWADHFDGSLEDVFDLQDRVALSVAGVIEPALQAAETARSAGRPTNDLTAYDLYLRACAMALSSSAQYAEALRLLELAINRDPHYGPALAWAAFCCHRLLLDGRSQDPAAHRQRGSDYARRALEVAGDDPAILVNAAYTLGYFGEDIGAMITLVDRALALNPSFARGWFVSGVLRLYAGQPEIAIDHAETSLRLSPRARGRLGSPYNRCLAFLHAALRRSSREAPAREPGRSEPPQPVSISRSLLCSFGTARRSAGDRRAAAIHYRCRDTRTQLPAERRTARALSIGPASGGRRGDLSQTRRFRRDPRRRCGGVFGANWPVARLRDLITIRPIVIARGAGIGGQVVQMPPGPAASTGMISSWFRRDTEGTHVTETNRTPRCPKTKTSTNSSVISSRSLFQRLTRYICGLLSNGSSSTRRVVRELRLREGCLRQPECRAREIAQPMGYWRRPLTVEIRENLSRPRCHLRNNV